jgi:short-subunit dehydrogenase
MPAFAGMTAEVGVRSSILKRETKMKSPFDLTGKVAVVTGSSRGIGRASAELLAQLGAKVVVSSRKADACEAVVKGIREQGGEAHVIPCNIGRK